MFFYYLKSKFFTYFVRIFFIFFIVNSLQAEDILINSSKIVIAFGSCNDQNRSQNFWNKIENISPHLFIFMGDNVYSKNKDASLEGVALAYESLKTNEYYRRFIKNIKHISIWDDHDYGLNDGGKDYIFKNQSKKLFLDFFNIPSSDERYYRDGLYKDFNLIYENKIVQIIILDTRFFKSDFSLTDQIGKKGKERYVPNYDEDNTILGKKQWKWLSEKLKKEVDLRIIVSSFQVLPDDHGWEKWGNFPLEKRKLFLNLMRTEKIKTVILSGDRHIGAFYSKKINNEQEIIEVTSSSLNKPLNFRVLEKDSLQIGNIVTQANFGLLKIDWNNNDLLIELISSDEKNTLNIPIIKFRSNL